MWGAMRGIKMNTDILQIYSKRISVLQSRDENRTTIAGGNGTLRVVYDVFIDANNVAQGRYKDYTVINGLICSEFDW